jgi:hypothetical protein
MVASGRPADRRRRSGPRYRRNSGARSAVGRFAPLRLPRQIAPHVLPVLTRPQRRLLGVAQVRTQPLRVRHGAAVRRQHNTGSRRDRHEPPFRIHHTVGPHPDAHPTPGTYPHRDLRDGPQPRRHLGRSRRQLGDPVGKCRGVGRPEPAPGSSTTNPAASAAPRQPSILAACAGPDLRQGSRTPTALGAEAEAPAERHLRRSCRRAPSNGSPGRPCSSGKPRPPRGCAGSTGRRIRRPLPSTRACRRSSPANPAASAASRLSARPRPRDRRPGWPRIRPASRQRSPLVRCPRKDSRRQDRFTNASSASCRYASTCSSGGVGVCWRYPDAAPSPNKAVSGASASYRTNVASVSCPAAT